MSTKSFLLSLISVAIFLSFYYTYSNYFSKKDKVINQTNSITLNAKNSDKNEVLYTLPKGEQIYSISHGKNVSGPKASQIIFNPLAYEIGQSQKVKIIFPESENVNSVVLYINTDNHENQKLILSKDPKANTWTGEWIPSDTIKSRYSVKITATGLAGEYINTMNFL